MEYTAEQLNQKLRLDIENFLSSRPTIDEFYDGMLSFRYKINIFTPQEMNLTFFNSLQDIYKRQQEKELFDIFFELSDFITEKFKNYHELHFSNQE